MKILKQEVMNKRKKFLRLIFSFFVTVGVFVFLFFKIPLPDVVGSLGKADFRIVLLALIVATLNNFLVGAYRWKLILKELDCPISFLQALLIKIGSNPIISVLPFRSGEFFKPLYLKEIKGFPYSRSIVSIVSEYLLNVVSLLIFILIGVVIYFFTGNNFTISMNPSTACFCFTYSSFSKHSSYNRLRAYFAELKKLLKKKSIFLYTLLFMLGELVTVYLLSIALTIPIPFYKLLIFMPVVILLANIPITILGLGTREAAILFFFAGFGPGQDLLSLGILCSFIEYIFPVIVGASLTGHLLTKVFWKKNESFINSA